MPVYKTKNVNFFKRWTPDVAYVLGFFTADGSMIKNKRGAHFIEFQITDKDLLVKIRKLFGSNHKITTRKRNNNSKISYRLQIGSKEIFNDLLKLGLTPNKSKTIKLLKIPDKYLSHFLRGYFDGDGCVNICAYQQKYKNSLSTIINSGFTSGSKKILMEIKNRLTKFKIIKGGTLYYHSKAYRLWFSINDSSELYKFMYSNLRNSLFLDRKKAVFEKYFKIR